MIQPGTKVRPPCEICGEGALVFMFDAYYCGWCVAKMDRLSKEKQRKEMEEMLK